MERYEPPEDPNNEPTQLASYSGETADGGTGSAYTAYGSEQQDYPGAYPEPVGQPPAPPPTPWYLQPAALIGWGVLSAILITVLVWGMVRLMNKEPGHTAPATTSVTSTPSSTMSSVTQSTAETTEAPTTTGPAAPATTSESPSESSQTTPTTTQTQAPATETTTGAPTATSTVAPTATSTVAPATTTAGGAIHLPSEITISLPPGL